MSTILFALKLYLGYILGTIVAGIGVFLLLFGIFLFKVRKD